MPFPRYRDPSGWQALLVPRCPEPALTEELEADAVVVGAGFTGIAAARAWAEARPDQRVVVLEAGVVGDADAGRGSGLLLASDPNGDRVSNDAQGVDPSTAARRQVLIGETIAALEALVSDHDMYCQFVRGGVYHGAVSEPGRRRLMAQRARLEAAGVDCRWLSGDALAARLGTRFYGAGLYTPTAALVQPAALIRGLANCLPLNATLHEESPVTALTREPGGWRAEGHDGSVKAPVVLLAISAALGALAGVPAAAGARIAPRCAWSALTAPLPRQVLARLGNQHGWAVQPAGERGATLRRTDDGRLLVRASFSADEAGDRTTALVRLRASLVRRYPNLPLAGMRFQHVWCGAAGFTGNGAPVWGEFAPGLWVAAGDSGAGAVTGTLFGSLLARCAMGDDGAAPVDVAGLFGSAGRLRRNPLRQLGRAVTDTLVPAGRRRRTV